MDIGVVGAGSFGTALACLLIKNGHNVTLWGYDKEDIINMQNTRENKKFLEGVLLDLNLNLTYNENDLKDCDMVVFAVPSNVIRENCIRFKNILKKDTIIVNVAKGIEEGSLLRLSEVIKEALPFCKISVLSGPSHAEEVGKALVTACVVSAYEEDVAKVVQNAFTNNTFRVYINMDIIGVELGGALKNLIALAAGAIDGCGLGDNAKAALITRGLTEIARLGVKMGANEETFFGLTGIGDLIVTCTSTHSRNRKAGFLLGKGKSLKDVLKEVHMVVEGVNIAKAAYSLSLKYDVNMPITKEVNEVLFNNKSIKDAIISLMTRAKKAES